MKIETLTIVGVGLIGASIGLAAKRRRVARRVLGAERQQAHVQHALEVGAIDQAEASLAGAVHQADLCVFCIPVDQIAGQILAAAPGCQAGALLTDTGSTKAAIVRQVEGKLPPGIDYVGSHPLTGSEKNGPEHADADLFEGRVVVVTQTARTDPVALERTAGFWQALGARVRVMDPESHDQALAMTSHLPHLVAAALAGILPAELKDLTASGFRDTTRVSAGEPALWNAIFAHNREAVLGALARLEERLQQFQQALQARDGTSMLELLTQAKKVRDALGS